MGVADLSLRGGGDSSLHRSHENGRDADLIWYASDDRGKPVCPTDCMPRYDGRFQARAPRQTPGVTFGAFSLAMPPFTPLKSRLVRGGKKA